MYWNIYKVSNNVSNKIQCLVNDIQNAHDQVYSQCRVRQFNYRTQYCTFNSLSVGHYIHNGVYVPSCAKGLLWYVIMSEGCTWYLSLQYSTLVHVCTDLMRTVCSPERMESLLTSAGCCGSESVTLQKIISWAKATSAAVNILKEKFTSFSDIVQPFVMALSQVRFQAIHFGPLIAFLSFLLQPLYVAT